jgi:hypothetical protein
MSAIASFRTAIALLLYDPSNLIFSTTETDQALRWALAEYSYKRPYLKTYDYSVLGTTSLHVMPADFLTRHVTKVELWNTSADKILNLPFYAYQVDEQWVIQTMADYKTGDVLQVTYSAVHQVDGLDSAAGTTLPLPDESIVQIGAAGQAASMRAMGTVESINMNANVVADYQKLADSYLARFRSMLTKEPGAAFALPEFPDTSMVF